MHAMPKPTPTAALGLPDRWGAVIVWAASTGLLFASCGSYSSSSYDQEGGWAEAQQETGDRGGGEELQATAAVASEADARPSPPPRPAGRPSPSPPRDYAPATPARDYAKKAYSSGPSGGQMAKSGRSYADPQPQAQSARPGEVKGAKEVSQPMVVYFGYLRLRVRRQIESFDAITKLAQAAGGYVQSLSGQTIVVRVPATDFDAAMARFAAVGEMLDRRIKAVDVARQFTDTESRLQVAVQARARLLQLLERVKNTDERLQILQEIKRLTEMIETAEGTLATLRNLANFFTITIDVEPVVADGGHIVHRSPFGWIQALTAHLVTLVEGKKAVKMTMPKGFVHFDQDDVFRAQAADTSLLRVGRVKNEPRGDAAFWSQAVQHEMEGRDEELVDKRTVGGWPILVTDTDLHLEVPQDVLAATVDELAAAGIVLQKSLQRVDLTEQIAQLQAKLKSKREILERLRSFFADSDTHSTLRIEQSMTQLVVEIEHLQGELNVAESSARMAHVQVSFQYHQKQRITYVRSPFEWLNTLDIDRFVAEF
ncbi:MAG: DUF4349 domain-containing protein [Deltaproteobacteria bacterium]|nr:DUF4349 domain-containing protein [Deltaproteobacteria bacterium]